MSQAFDDSALGQLFTEARTHNGWKDQSIPEETLRELYDLIKMGPTSANCSPGRFVFVCSGEGKEKLEPCLCDSMQASKLSTSRYCWHKSSCSLSLDISLCDT